MEFHVIWVLLDEHLLFLFEDPQVVDFLLHFFTALEVPGQSQVQPADLLLVVGHPLLEGLQRSRSDHLIPGNEL